MLLSIIVPAYNEEKRIGEMLATYWDYFKSQDVEFVIVVNGSTDNTIGITTAFAAAHPERVQQYDIKEKIGKGGALHLGYRKARGEWIGFVDADLATVPGEFQKVISVALEHDGAIASRWKRGSEIVNRSIMRNIASMGFRVMVKLLFWFPYADTQCGAKVFRREAIVSVVPHLRVQNMATDVETLHFLRRKGYDIVEVPTRWIHRSGSAFLGSPAKFFFSALRIVGTLLSIRLRYQ